MSVKNVFNLLAIELPKVAFDMFHYAFSAKFRAKIDAEFDEIESGRWP